MAFDEEDDVSGATGSSAAADPSPASGAGGAAQPQQAAAPQSAYVGQMASVGAVPPGSQDNSSTPSQPQAQKPWYQRVYTGVLDALGGSNQVMLERDPQTGKMVATATKSGPGQQWKRIISGALAGAGSAMAHAGTGPGASIRGAGLGVEAGIKLRNDQAQQARTDADDDLKAQQETALNKARTAQLAFEGAKGAWELSWEKTKALQGQLDLENQWNDRIKDAGEGSANLGVFPTFRDYMKATQEDPSLHDASANGELYPIVHVSADGIQDGISVYKVTQNWKDQKTTEPTPFQVFVPSKKPGDEPHFETQIIPAGAMSNGAAADHQQKQNNLALDAQNKYIAAKALARQRNAKADEDERSDTPTGAVSFAPGSYDPHIAAQGDALANGNGNLKDLTGKTKMQVEQYLNEKHPNLDQHSISLSGDQVKRVDLANNALHNLDDIGTRLARRPDLVGVIQGRLSQGKTLVGTNDPDLAAIDTALDNYALAATGAHGVRSVDARKSAKEALLNSFKNGPQAMQASIQAARGSLQNLAAEGRPKDKNGNPYKPQQQPQNNQQPQTKPQGGFDPSKFAVAN